MMRISVFGSGYVGLVTAAGLADMGHRILCVDIDEPRVARLCAGEVPFFEPGLADLVHRNLRGERLRFATALDDEFTSADAHFVAVGTPPMADGRADTSAVFAVGRTLAKRVAKGGVVAVKSTVPVGTCDALQKLLDELCPHRMRVASNPEFLKEGAAVDDFFRPHRVVIGVDERETGDEMREMYRPLQLSSDRVIVMSRRSSELTKYAANSMLATRISFMNELARLCDTIGADIHSVRAGIGSDERIGRSFLYAGPGYGGSCFPKDVSALIHLGRDAGVSLGVVEAVAKANEAQRLYVWDKIRSLFADGVKGKTVAVWGLAFKPMTDDVRDAPAGTIVQKLLEAGAKVRAHDPEAAENFAAAYAPASDAMSYHINEYEALDGADALVLMTEWRHFRNPDFREMKRRMRGNGIVDARSIWTMFGLGKAGFVYRTIGSPAANS
jgi:UDPglucose 6-dehydrogenase